MLLINKHQSANLPVNVTVSGGTLPSTAYVYSYGKPQDSAATDLAQSTMAISGSSFSYTTGSYSLTVITVTAPAPVVPAAPSGLTASSISKSQINLAWTDNSNNETGFKVDRATNSGFTANLVTTTVGSNVTSFQATGLTANTNYYFRVRATNAVGDSANSNTASGRTKAK